MNDAVNNPTHYVYGQFECIEFIQAITSKYTGVQAFDVGNAIKYLYRCFMKESDNNTTSSLKSKGIQDIKKALWYLNDCKKHSEISFTSSINDVILLGNKYCFIDEVCSFYQNSRDVFFHNVLMNIYLGNIDFAINETKNYLGSIEND